MEDPYGKSSKHKSCFGGFVWKIMENLGTFGSNRSTFSEIPQDAFSLLNVSF